MDDTNDNPRMIRRLGAALVLTVTAVVALASPAWAHVEIEPAEAVAGATESLTFSVAYEGSATTGLVVQLPEGASVSEVPAKAGWTSAVDEAEHTVSWTGGSVAADDTFSVVVVLPTTPGEVLFPTIQQTVAGEVAWIGEEEGEDHGSNPAPRLTLVADPAATTTTEAPTTTTEATTTTDELPGTTLEAEQRDDGSTSAAPWLIGSAIVALIAVAVGGTFLKRRADRAQEDGSGDGGDAGAGNGGDAL